MESASESLEFEKADGFLQMIHQIEHVTQVQHVDNPAAKDCDVVGLYREADAVMIALLIFPRRKDHRLGAFQLPPHRLQRCGNPRVIPLAALQKSYRTSLRNFHPVRIAPANGSRRDSLRELPGRKWPSLRRKKGKNSDLVEMGLRNAKALFVREQDARSLKEKMLLDLQETLQLTRFPRRIECFDTSNISGTDPVASLACFVHGEKDKSPHAPLQDQRDRKSRRLHSDAAGAWAAISPEKKKKEIFAIS